MTEPSRPQTSDHHWGVAIIATAAAIWLLTYAKDLLIPLAVALLISWVIDALADGVQSLKLGPVQLPGWASLAVALSFMVIGMTGAGLLIAENASELIDRAPGYEEKLDQLLLDGAAFLGLKQTLNLSGLFAMADLSAVLTQTARALSELIGNAFLIFIYVGFILAEERMFDRKIAMFFVSKEREGQVREMLDQVTIRIRSYLWMKTLTSLMTGLASYIILMVFAVDFALFWSFLIFMLNFIPAIGSIVGAIVPALMALVQFGDPLVALLVLAALGVVAQFFIGNFIEPRMMGRSLNLSPFIIILSLSAWGFVWGIAGMFLSVPLTVVAMIICSHFEATRPIAVVLSSDGEIVRPKGDVPAA